MEVSMMSWVWLNIPLGVMVVLAIVGVRSGLFSSTQMRGQNVPPRCGPTWPAPRSLPAIVPTSARPPRAFRSGPGRADASACRAPRARHRQASRQPVSAAGGPGCPAGHRGGVAAHRARQVACVLAEAVVRPGSALGDGLVQVVAALLEHGREVPPHRLEQVIAERAVDAGEQRPVEPDTLV